MRYFFDTEFFETPSGVQLISIGMIDEHGRSFYGETDFDHSAAPEWVKQNVLTKLSGPIYSAPRIAAELKEFVKPGPEWRDTEFWAYYGAYDWYLLCRLFGGMLNLPKGWPRLFHELRIFLDERGFPQYTQPEDGAHHAMSDAAWNRKAFLEHTASNDDAIL